MIERQFLFILSLPPWIELNWWTGALSPISQTSISSKLEKELGNHRSDTESATQTIINLILEDDLKYKSILEGFTNLSESHLQKKYPNQVGKKMDFIFRWNLAHFKFRWKKILKNIFVAKTCLWV